MRQGCTLALMVLMPVLGRAGAVRAQDEADSLWLPDSVLVDSSGLMEVEDEDTLTRRTPDDVESGANPYLREVRSSAALQQWWGSIALGAGNEAFRSRATGPVYSPTTAGPTFALEAGRRFSRFMGLGVELFGWLGDFQNDYFSGFGSLLLVARVYPLGAMGPFVKLGGGLAAYGVYDAGYDVFASSDIGAGYMLGAGWEIPVSRSLLLSPIVELHRAAMMANNPYHERVLSVGLMLTWSGRQGELGPFSSEE